MRQTIFVIVALPQWGRQGLLFPSTDSKERPCSLLSICDAPGMSSRHPEGEPCTAVCDTGIERTSHRKCLQAYLDVAVLRKVEIRVVALLLRYRGYFVQESHGRDEVGGDERSDDGVPALRRGP